MASSKIKLTQQELTLIHTVNEDNLSDNNPETLAALECIVQKITAIAIVRAKILGIRPLKGRRPAGTVVANKKLIRFLAQPRTEEEIMQYMNYATRKVLLTRLSRIRKMENVCIARVSEHHWRHLHYYDEVENAPISYGQYAACRLLKLPQHYREAGISIQTLCNEFSVSRKYLTTVLMERVRNHATVRKSGDKYYILGANS